MIEVSSRLAVSPALFSRAGLIRVPARRSYSAKRQRPSKTSTLRTAQSLGGDEYEYEEGSRIPKGLSYAEKLAFVEDDYGWSLKVPYSKELYHNPVDERLVRRVRATGFLRESLGYGEHRHIIMGLGRPLLRSCMRDVRFICIDADRVKKEVWEIDGRKTGRTLSGHIGVSVLDTKNILDVALSPLDPPYPGRLIQSYQYCVESEVPKEDGFLFGKSESISALELKKKMDHLHHGPQIVGVVYSGRRDLLAMKDFGATMQQKFWLDVCYASYIPLRATSPYSLGHLMREFGIPHDNLHSPGNDAHFTLRAMLAIAAVDALQEAQHLQDVPHWLDLALKIARSPIPTIDPQSSTSWDPNRDPRPAKRKTPYLGQWT
ncbi:hypothetical protein NW762_007373 [Fusarium torreyae]|uniref:Gfd2/YDR514C-like C-terminal domain-containing protein n=1 Tax=Fusarium torreyae TaxID=1237075 RepID=A0A9W8S162_9HYPO|nr:hypothetical protein NW762_007373 [Fusarium torreyae]